MVFTPFAPSAQLGLLGSTGLAGYALVNGTGNVFSWTSPNDGNMHRVFLLGEQVITVAQTGGIITLTLTDPGNTVRGRTVFAGGLAASFATAPLVALTVAPNTAVTLAQTSALTAGNGTMYLEMWGS